jgi:hypothetical protein
MNGKWMERLGQARMWIFCVAVGVAAVVWMVRR